MSYFQEYDPKANGRALIGLAVRSATARDALDVARIHVEREGGNIEEVLPRVIGEWELAAKGEIERYTCVALTSGRVVGFGRCAYLDGVPELPAGWYLNGLIVEPKLRRRGIGEAITRHRLEWLWERTKEVYCFMTEINRASIDLHAKLGFVEVRRGLKVSLPGVENIQVLCRKFLT